MPHHHHHHCSLPVQILQSILTFLGCLARHISAWTQNTSTSRMHVDVVTLQWQCHENVCHVMLKPTTCDWVLFSPFYMFWLPFHESCWNWIMSSVCNKFRCLFFFVIFVCLPKICPGRDCVRAYAYIAVHRYVHLLLCLSICLSTLFPTHLFSFAPSS